MYCLHFSCQIILNALECHVCRPACFHVTHNFASTSAFCCPLRICISEYTQHTVKVRQWYVTLELI